MTKLLRNIRKKRKTGLIKKMIQINLVTRLHFSNKFFDKKKE